MSSLITQNNRICLAVTVEADITNINTANKEQFEFNKDRYYEKEAIRMFRSWRKNAGWLKDIPIYALCITENTPSLETQDIFRELNVSYIECFNPITSDFFSGFWNIPLGGKWFEENLEEDIIIKIDLDMHVIKPIPENLFSISNNDCIVGVFDDIHTAEDSWKRLDIEAGLKQSNTCLMITHRKSRIYSKWWIVLNRLWNEYKDGQLSDFLEIYKLNPDDLEEVSFDILRLEDNSKYSSLSRFQIGEHYPSVDTFCDVEVEKIYFWHEHWIVSDSYNKIKERLRYWKRTNQKGK